MDYRRLQAFCKVFELRSFSRAGEHLLLSQPTISAHVAALEKELDTRLLDRMGRDVMPTAAGKALYEAAMQAFAALDSARSEIRLMCDEVAGDLTLAASTIPAHYLLPEVMAAFRREHPGVRFRLVVGDSHSIMARVAEGEAMLGVAGMREELPGLNFTRLLNDELVIIAPPGLVPADQELAAADLAALPWVIRPEGSGTGRALAAGLAGLGVDVRNLEHAAVVDSTQAVLQCVSAGVGVSVTSRLAAGPLLARGELAQLRVAGLELKREFFMVRLAGRKMFPASRVFAEFLAAKCRGVRQ